MVISAIIRSISKPVILFIFFISSFALYAADDMWGSVFAYQQKMANYGQAEAQVKLGGMYEEGHGVEQSFDKAEQWYKKALAQGFSPAQVKLNQLQQHRQRAAEAIKEQQQATQQRIASEKAERERLEQERVELQQAEQERLLTKEREEQESERRSRRLAADKEKSAEEERIARKRAQEAMAKMLATPEAFDED